MAHMKSSATRARKSALMFWVVGLSVLTAATVAGQGPFAPAHGPLDLILQKLVAIEEAVAPPEPSEVTLRTSPVNIIDGVDTLVFCNVANVSASTISVTIRLLNQQGGIAIAPIVTVPSGHSTSSGVNAIQGEFRCAFTFTGFADDIRANMTAADNNQIANPLAPPTAVFEAR